MMAIKRSTCLTANRSRCFSLASQRRMNDTQTVFHHFNFAVTFRSPWRRSSSPSLRPTRIRVAAFRKFPLRISRFRYSTQATPAFSFPLPFTKLLPTFTRYLHRPSRVTRGPQDFRVNMQNSDTVIFEFTQISSACQRTRVTAKVI